MAPPELVYALVQVRVKLVAASICHTDLWVWRGGDMGLMAPFPMVLGHEGGHMHS